MSNVDTYSYSKLNFDCMYCYYLDYIAQGKEKLRKANNGFAQLGIFCHSIFEDFSNGNLVQFELKQKFLDEFDEKVPYGVELLFENGFKKDLTEKYKEDCANFLEKYQGLENQIAAEEHFSFLMKIKDKTLIFRGVIDAITKDENGEYHIVDFKSHSLFKTKEEADEYFRQLYLYSLYVKYKYKKFPRTLSFLQFRVNHTETRDFSEEALEEALDWAYSQIGILETTQFWSPKCLAEEEKRKQGLKPDLFMGLNLCNYRLSCPYSPRHKEEG